MIQSFVSFSYVVLCVSTWAQGPLAPACGGEEYQSRHLELKKIYDQDQADRSDFTHSNESKLIEMLKRDRIRIKKVAEIFAQGCLKSAEDYLHAATVFQHGEVPDHFYQTYIWANKAFQMGLKEAGQMAGNGIDRYLMNLGQKQLFGGQAITDPTSTDVEVNKRCFCLWPVENTFPDSQREALKFKTRTQLLAWLKEINQERKGCTESFCKSPAKDTPRGSLPGIW